MTANIIHWNIRGYRTNYQHLRLLLSHSNSIVTCLQECRMPVPLPSPPRGFQMYHQHGPQGRDGLDHGGVCILVKDHIGHVTIPLVTDLQAVAIRPHIGRKITICSLYIPPNYPLEKQQLYDLITQLPAPFMLLGDFNARHALWGDNTSNSKGRIVETLLNEGVVAILNDGSPTHFHGATNSFSNVDLSLCSPDLIPDFSWTISNDLYHSDHFPVRLSIEEQTTNLTSVRYIII